MESSVLWQYTESQPGRGVESLVLGLQLLSLYGESNLVAVAANDSDTGVDANGSKQSCQCKIDCCEFVKRQVSLPALREYCS